MPESMKGQQHVRTKRDEIVLSHFLYHRLHVRQVLPSIQRAPAYGRRVGRQPVQHLYPVGETTSYPICDDDYFQNEATALFIRWVQAAYGSDYPRGESPLRCRCPRRKRRPERRHQGATSSTTFTKQRSLQNVSEKAHILGFFDSGKKTALKRLSYMHRYQSDLLCPPEDGLCSRAPGAAYPSQLAAVAEALEHRSAGEKSAAGKAAEEAAGSVP